MRLAEALMLRAELKNEADELFKRIEENAFYKQDETPMEDAKELFRKMEDVLLEIKVLEEKIWRTNMNTLCQGKKTIYDLLRERDYLIKIVYRKNRVIAMHKSDYQNKMYYLKDESSVIKKVFAFDIKTLIKERDEAAKKCKEINLMIQRKNWEVDLME